MSTTKKVDSRTIPQLRERAEELGVDDDPRVTRANGHRPKKADWVEVVQEAEEKEKPSQAEIVRRGLEEGLSNKEIQGRVLEIHPDQTMPRENPAGMVSGVMAHERNRETDWWMENREAIKEDRPRIKITVPSEEEGA